MLAGNRRVILWKFRHENIIDSFPSVVSTEISGMTDPVAFLDALRSTAAMGNEVSRDDALFSHLLSYRHDENAVSQGNLSQRLRAATEFLNFIGSLGPARTDDTIKRKNVRNKKRPLKSVVKSDKFENEFFQLQTDSPRGDTDSDSSDGDSHSNKAPVYICKPPKRDPRLRKNWESILLTSGLINSRTIHCRVAGAPLFITSVLNTRLEKQVKEELLLPCERFLKDVKYSVEKCYYRHLIDPEECLHLEKNRDPYDPFLLDDPQLKSGKHRTILALPGFMESVLAWVNEKELRKELNGLVPEQFRQKHVWLHPSVSLSKIRKIKRLFLNITAKLVESPFEM